MEKIIFPICTLLLGAFLGHFLTVLRERKKSLDENIEQTITEIQTLVQLASEYHTKQERDEYLAAYLVFYIELLDKRVGNIIEKSNKHIKFWNVRVAITKKNFDKSNFMQQKFNGEIISEISNAATSIIKDLLKLK